MIMLGDAMNMRHPLMGGGMTVVLKDVALLGARLIPTEVPLLEDTGAVLDQMRKFHWKRKEVQHISQCSWHKLSIFCSLLTVFHFLHYY